MSDDAMTTWTPRRGAPAALPGEDRQAYSKRLRRARNQRHHTRKVREREAGTPKAKVEAAAAAKPRRRALPGPIHDERPPGGADGRVLGVLVGAFDPQGRPPSLTVFDRNDGTHEIREHEWLEAPREDRYVPATVVTSAGSYSYDPGDVHDIARIEGLLTSEPGLEGIDPNALRAALSRVERGREFRLTAEVPS